MTGWYTSDGASVSGLPEPPAFSFEGLTRRAEYVMDNESFGRFMLSSQIRKPVAEVCSSIAQLAGHLAPHRKDRGTVPDGVGLENSFKVRVEAGTLSISGSRGPNVRVKCEVYSESRAAAPMEFGNKHVGKGHRMLGRAGAEHGDFKGDLERKGR